MTKFAVLAKPGWDSAKRLAAVLDARVITKEPSLKIKGRVLINYGRSDVQHIEGVVNRHTANATDKTSALRLCRMLVFRRLVSLRTRNNVLKRKPSTLVH